MRTEDGETLHEAHSPEILVVEAGGGRSRMICALLSRGGRDVGRVVQCGAAGISSSAVPPRVVLLDCGGLSEAVRFLDVIQEQSDAVPGTIVLDTRGGVRAAVEVMRHGASDYFAGPSVDEKELLRAIERVERAHKATQRFPNGKGKNRPEQSLDRMVGNSPSIRKCIAQARAAAGNLSNVLIVGESGTGKDLLARGIHLDGIRSRGPYTPVNCAAIPRELIEGELFGYVRGAFSGAVRDSLGLFRGSNGGTLFLDELTEMPTQSQAKLLRAIQERAIRPLGTHTEVPVDVRVIAATNRDLREAIEQHELRRDLYYRLSVISIHVPPLRERPEDVLLLLDHLICKFEEQFRTGFPGFSDEAMEALCRHSWPGNVRELENLVEGFFALGNDGPIRLTEVEERLDLLEAPIVPRTPADLSLDTMEKEMVQRALQRAGGDKTRAAEMLGVSRMTLYRKLRSME